MNTTRLLTEWAESNTAQLGVSCASGSYISAGAISIGYVGNLHMVHEL